MNRSYVLGVNLGSSGAGKELHDGAACLLTRTGIVGAVAEERILRIKRAGGYEKAVESLCQAHNVRHKDLRSVVVSSCCEPQPDIEELSPFANVPVLSCNHHVSHACSAFCTSPFERAIVLVLDAGGNTLGSSAAEKWWEARREQHTHFLGDNSGLKLIGRDFDDAYAAGFGEIFRAFTYFLGWPSSQHAGNVMALAAHGNANRFKTPRVFFRDEKGKFQSPIKNDPNNPIQMAKAILDSCGIRGGVPRAIGQPICELHKDIAAWIQNEFEMALIEIVDGLIKDTGINDICLAGGVAYNCKAISSIRARSKAQRIYVGPASGDHGQCLGNAMFGTWRLDGQFPRFERFSPYLGPKYDIKKDAITTLILEKKLTPVIKEPGKIQEFVAQLLAMGCIVGWYQGRSEFGPRALGNRSILASPSLLSLSGRLNELKGRESFMPFAPSILSGEVERFFGHKEDVPYMTEIVYAHEKQRMLIEGALNSDDSSRIQTVRREDNEHLFSLISEYYKLTGIPMVLNTSFNAGGEPIIETVEDAIDCYAKLGLDALVIGKTVILAQHTNRARSASIRTRLGARGFEDIAISDIVVRLSERYKNKTFVPRDRFLLQADFFDWVTHGRKSTTIRYRRQAVEYPIRRKMPLFVTNDYSRAPRGNQEATLRISDYQVKAFGDLDDEDARRDGFANKSALRSVLHEIYGDICGSELVAIYGIECTECVNR